MHELAWVIARSIVRAISRAITRVQIRLCLVLVPGFCVD